MLNIYFFAKNEIYFRYLIDQKNYVQHKMAPPSGGHCNRILFINVKKKLLAIFCLEVTNEQIKNG